MKRNDIGVAVRDYYMVAGYWGKWLVAIDENNHYFVVSKAPFVFSFLKNNCNFI